MPRTKVIIAALIIPMIGIAIHQLLMSPPPADHGSGQMFDMIAGRYDLINRVLALRMDIGWRKNMVQRVKESVMQKTTHPLLLDIATGTADVALLLADAMEAATVLGMDPSENMLEVGRQKVKEQEKVQQVRLKFGAVQDFGSLLQAETFDGATMSFGIRNVPDKQEALCQIHRVLKPNAVFCILEFSEPAEDSGVLGFIARLFIRHVVPVVGGVLSGAPREYLHLQNSIKDFPSPPDFVKLMENVQCGDGGAGSFRVDELVQMNGGSVQLYVTTAITNE